VRIGLFSDCEGDAAALEAVLSALSRTRRISSSVRYLLDWGTSRWAHTLWMRLRRSDPAGRWLEDVPDGQARILAADLE
jgi:hypothetical protein